MTRGVRARTILQAQGVSNIREQMGGIMSIHKTSKADSEGSDDRYRSSMRRRASDARHANVQTFIYETYLAGLLHPSAFPESPRFRPKCRRISPRR